MKLIMLSLLFSSLSFAGTRYVDDPFPVSTQSCFIVVQEMKSEPVYATGIFTSQIGSYYSGTEKRRINISSIKGYTGHSKEMEISSKGDKKIVKFSDVDRYGQYSGIRVIETPEELDSKIINCSIKPTPGK